jgi:negative regulator of sigma E activity
MEEKITLTQEELLKLQDLDNKRGQLIEQFGIIEINIQDLKIQKTQLIEELSKLKSDELDLGNLLQQKYGYGNINLSTGEITPR